MKNMKIPTLALILSWLAIVSPAQAQVRSTPPSSPLYIAANKTSAETQIELLEKAQIDAADAAEIELLEKSRAKAAQVVKVAPNNDSIERLVETGVLLGTVVSILFLLCFVLLDLLDLEPFEYFYTRRKAIARLEDWKYQIEKYQSEIEEIIEENSIEFHARLYPEDRDCENAQSQVKIALETLDEAILTSYKAIKISQKAKWIKRTLMISDLEILKLLNDCRSLNRVERELERVRKNLELITKTDGKENRPPSQPDRQSTAASPANFSSDINYVNNASSNLDINSDYWSDFINTSSSCEGSSSNADSSCESFSE
jgi:tetratricopeptide (TPR) repeat protein